MISQMTTLGSRESVLESIDSIVWHERNRELHRQSKASVRKRLFNDTSSDRYGTKSKASQRKACYHFRSAALDIEKKAALMGEESYRERVT